MSDGARGNDRIRHVENFTYEIPELVQNIIGHTSSSMTQPSVIEFASLDEVDFTGRADPVLDFAIPVQGLRHDCRLNRHVANDHMYVAFHGRVDRTKRPPPAFARWNWHMIWRAPILCLADPLLSLDPDLRAGWFIGTREIDVADAAARIILKVADRLGIPSDRIVCYGSSAGGFSAIAVALRLHAGRFVALNPQTCVHAYHEGRVRPFSRAFDSRRTLQQNAAAYPERWSVIRAYAAARSGGRGVRGVIVQNKADVFHYERHFLPFCSSLSIPPEGGYAPTGDVRAVVFEDECGHQRESPPLARMIATELVPWALGAKVAGQETECR